MTLGLCLVTLGRTSAMAGRQSVSGSFWGKGAGQDLLSQLSTYSISYRSLRASIIRPMRRFARSGAVLTVTSLQGPLRTDMVVMI